MVRTQQKIEVQKERKYASTSPSHWCRNLQFQNLQFGENYIKVVRVRTDWAFLEGFW